MAKNLKDYIRDEEVERMAISEGIRISVFEVKRSLIHFTVFHPRHPNPPFILMSPFPSHLLLSLNYTELMIQNTDNTDWKDFGWKEGRRHEYMLSHIRCIGIEEMSPLFLIRNNAGTVVRSVIYLRLPDYKLVKLLFDHEGSSKGAHTNMFFDGACFYTDRNSSVIYERMFDISETKWDCETITSIGGKVYNLQSLYVNGIVKNWTQARAVMTETFQPADIHVIGNKPSYGYYIPF